MVTHTPFYNDLYKFTNRYKEEEARKTLSRFIFREPSVSTDGLKFIDSEILYSSKLDVIPNSRVYFKNFSSPNSRFLNKDIRICNIPTKYLPVNRSLEKSLNKYLIDRITYNNKTGKYECNEIESLGRRKNYWKNNYPDLKYIKTKGENLTKNKEGISKYLYGLQFNSLEFFRATGIYIEVLHVYKPRLDYINYYKLSNFTDIGDGLNIRISLQTPNTLEIDVKDTAKHNSLMYELRIYSNIKDVYTEKFKHTIDPQNNRLMWYGSYKSKTHDDLKLLTISDRTMVIFSSYGENNYDFYSESIEFNDNIESISSYLGSYNKASEKFYLDEINDSGIPKNKITKSLLHLLISFPIRYVLNDNNYSLLHDENGFYITLNLDSYPLNLIDRLTGETSITLQGTFLIDHNIANDNIEAHDIVHDIPYYEPDLNNVKEDEENLVKSLPFSLQTILENNSTFTVKKIDRILSSSLVLWNNTPCIRYTLNSKHNNVLFFKDNKLLTPDYIDSYGDTYVIYININNICEMNQTIKNIIYKLDVTTISIELPETTNFYIAYDTDIGFIENMRYDIRSIYKYVNLDKTQRYSIETNEVDGDLMSQYIEDDGGQYVKYKNYYLELGPTNYYLDSIDDKYKTPIPDGYDGDIYNKLKTNEYLLPVNKDIDLNKLVITIEDISISSEVETKYRKDPMGAYILLTEDRYYATYSRPDKTGLYIKINGEYILWNDSYSEYTGTFYLKREPGYVIPPYYYAEDIRYREIGKKCIKLANVFNLRKFEDIVSIDSFKTEDDELIEYKTYTKNELISKICKEKLNLDYSTINDLYYEDINDNQMKIYRSNINKEDIVDDILYYKDLDGNYIPTDIVLDIYNNGLHTIKSYMDEVSSFIDMNRVYKFTLVNGEILDGGIAETDEYINVIDGGYADSFSDYPIGLLSKEDALEAISEGETVYMLFNGELIIYNELIYPDYDGVFYTKDDFSPDTEIDKNYNYMEGELYLDDDYPIYDFNFSSPYSIIDSNIKAYRIDSSYSKYFLNNEDEFLAYVIPNQLINSENKLMTFLDGNMTDEYVINKNLYSKLFNGDTIISFTDNPDDYSGKDYSYRVDANGEYYYDVDTKSYIHDPNRDKDILKRHSTITYYRLSEPIDPDNIETGEDIWYIDSELYDLNDISSTTKYELSNGSYFIDKNGTYYRLKNGHYILIENYVENEHEIESYKRYFELENEYNGSYFICTVDYYLYTTPYSKNISTVFMINLKNMVLYQNHNGITYNNGIFSVANTLDAVVRNERQIYKDIYFIPLSTKYMLFFIDGKFVNPFVKIITPTKFVVDNLEEILSGNNEINQVQIYVFDKFLYNLDQYKNYYFTKQEILLTDSATHQDILDDNGNVVIDYTIYKYNDTLWNDYSDKIIEKYSDYNNPNIAYKAKDTGFSLIGLASLYEIFGKYILNKYDIDHDPTLFDEIREYFAALFDENNRMKLELLQDRSKRKYIY